MENLWNMKSKNIWIIAGIIIILIIVGIVYVNNLNQKRDVIKIGYIGPLSGALVYTGEPVKNGFELANSKYNSYNKNISVIYEDDKCSPVDALNAARKLINIDNVNIIVSGVCSSSTLAIAPLAEENKKILISPVSASPDIKNAGDYVFRIAASSDLLGSKAADIVYDLGYSKIGIIYELNEYPRGWKDVFKTEFIKLGGEIVDEESFNSGETDIKTQLIKIKEKNPDVILMVVLSVPSGIQILKEINELDIKTPLVGNELFSYKPVINSYPNTTEGMFVATYDYDLNSEEMKLFLSEYNSKYNKEVSEEIYGALGYDVYMLLYDSIKTCDGDNPECIKNYFNNLGETAGVGGNYTLDENGDAVRNVVLRKIVGGKMEYA